MLLGLEQPAYPVVGLIHLVLIPIWLAFGAFIFFGITVSSYVGFAFWGYMFFAAMEQWGWVDSNVYDLVFSWLYVNLESNFIVGFLVFPTKQLIGTFLQLEDEKRFTPLNEWQAYFFTILVYPYIYFMALAVSFTQLVTIPIMLFWYLIDPEILVAGTREDGTAVPQDNYAMIWAESDAITALLTLDMRYLYKGKDAFTISVTHFITHWVTSLVLVTTSGVMFFPMGVWLLISAFQVLVIYMYSFVVLDKGDSNYDGIDIYY